MEFTRLSTLNEADILMRLESLDFKEPGGNSWYRAYLLLKEVEDRRLYAPKYSSFKPWLNRYCKEYGGIGVNRIYSFKRAGKLLERYLDLWNIDYTDLKPFPAAQTIINIEKSALLEFAPDTAGFNDFIERGIVDAITGKLTRDKSALIYKQIKLESQGQLSQSLMRQAVLENFEWLAQKEANPSNYVKRETPLRDLYEGIPDFRLENRQADIALFENLSAEDPNDVRTHLVNIIKDEVKPEAIDATLALKDYFDYAWIVLKKHNLEGIENIPEEIGILLYEEPFAEQIGAFLSLYEMYKNPKTPGTLRVVRQAQKILGDTSPVFKRYPLYVH